MESEPLDGLGASETAVIDLEDRHERESRTARDQGPQDGGASETAVIHLEHLLAVLDLHTIPQTRRNLPASNMSNINIALHLDIASI